MAKKGKKRRILTTDTYKNRVLEAFEKADDNKDGTISREELAKLLQKLDPGWNAEKAGCLFSGIDKNENDALEVAEFVDWVFGNTDSIGRVAVEAAKQATVAACETVPSALSRIGSPLGDIKVVVNDISGNAILPDFGLFADDTMLILRHAAEAAMSRKLGYRCKLLLGEKTLADEDKLPGSGLENGSVLTAVLTIDPLLQELIERVPKLTEVAREGQDFYEDLSLAEGDAHREAVLETLQQVNELGCFGDVDSLDAAAIHEGKLRDPPLAGQRGIPGWSGRDVLGPLVPLFGEWLQDENQGVRELGCWCLSRCGVDALPFLPHLAAMAWDTKSADVCIQATETLCLLATQAPQQVVPVVAELVCHDWVSVSCIAIEWLTWSGQSILFWRTMPGAKEIGRDRIKQALGLRAKETGDPILTATSAAKFLRLRFPDLVENLLKEDLHPKVMNALNPDEDDYDDEDGEDGCPDFRFVFRCFTEDDETVSLVLRLPACIGGALYGEEEE